MERWRVLGNPLGAVQPQVVHRLNQINPARSPVRWFFIYLEVAWHRIALLYIVVVYIVLLCFALLGFALRCIALHCIVGLALHCIALLSFALF